MNQNHTNEPNYTKLVMPRQLVLPLDYGMLIKETAPSLYPNYFKFEKLKRTVLSDGIALIYMIFQFFLIIDLVDTATLFTNVCVCLLISFVVPFPTESSSFVGI